MVPSVGRNRHSCPRPKPRRRSWPSFLAGLLLALATGLRADQPAANATPDLGARFQAEVQAWADPNGGGVYRVELRPNPAGGPLRPLPKDVLFLLDASSSMARPKLEAHFAGTALALNSLAPDDFFNVLLLHDRPQSLFPEPAPATAANLQTARNLLARPVPSGRADLLAVLSDLLAAKRHDATRPWQLFLATDGRIETPQKIGPDEFLRRLATANREAGARLHAFSCGDGANRLVLDFLAFRGRGLSRHLPSVEKAAVELARSVDNAAEILLTDLRGEAPPPLAAELWPRELPDLCRCLPLRLWGRYPAGTGELALDLAGRGRDGAKFALKLRLPPASAQPAGPELATEYATQKLYSLLALWTATGNLQARDQARQVAADYQIVFPE